MSRTKRRIANLDPAESYKPHLVTTQYLDSNGVVRTTTHDGNFSPSPQEPAIVFVPAQFCDQFYIMRIMEDRKENPQQVENGSYKYLRAAFLSPNSQQSATGKSTIDGNEQNASVIGRISVKTSTTSDFSGSFKEFLEPYIDNYEIIFTDAQIEDWLDSGTHTIKVEYNGEVSETLEFTVE